MADLAPTRRLDGLLLEHSFKGARMLRCEPMRGRIRPGGATTHRGVCLRKTSAMRAFVRLDFLSIQAGGGSPIWIEFVRQDDT